MAAKSAANASRLTKFGRKIGNDGRDSRADYGVTTSGPDPVVACEQSKAGPDVEDQVLVFNPGDGGVLVAFHIRSHLKGQALR